MDVQSFLMNVRAAFSDSTAWVVHNFFMDAGYPFLQVTHGLYGGDPMTPILHRRCDEEVDVVRGLGRRRGLAGGQLPARDAVLAFGLVCLALSDRPGFSMAHAFCSARPLGSACVQLSAASTKQLDEHDKEDPARSFFLGAAHATRVSAPHP